MSANEAFYRRVYDEVYAENPQYGTTNHGGELQPSVSRFLSDRDNPSMIDCGCGRFNFLKMFDANVVRLYGVDVHRHDPVPAGITFLHGGAWNLDAVPGRVDAITSFDMLEHLREFDVEPTFETWSDKLKPGGMLFMTIATHYASTPAPEGVENLHLTVHPMAWWRDKLSRWFEFPEHEHQNPPVLIARKTAE